MEYLVYYREYAIGRIIRATADTGMGVVDGPFIPLPAYEGVRAVFQVYAKLVSEGQAHGETLDRYYHERDNLTCECSITTLAGVSVKTLWIDIKDFSAYLEEDAYRGIFCVGYVDGGFFLNPVLWDV